ncbi:MAG: hypothetical protein KBT68_11595 [bacterium]|nr:hypothetical protein [Candidatus Colisoma equi]
MDTRTAKVLSSLTAAIVSLHGFAYQDELITSSDDSVKRIILPSRVVYVFDNPSAGQVSVTARTALTVDRTLVVAGGGGGGYNGAGAGGGGGGVLANDAPVLLSEGAAISLSVGAGGVGRTTAAAEGCQGGDSILTIGGATYTAKGGGYGGGWGSVNSSVGGSGGGNAMGNGASAGTAGQGNAGASGPDNQPGGGGGAGEPGHRYEDLIGGVGGEGLPIDITGPFEVYGSGGGTALWQNGNLGKYAGKGGTNAGDGGAAGGNAVDGFGGGGGGGNTAGGKGGDGTVVLSIVATIGDRYEDAILSSTDCSVRRVMTDEGLAYIFTNTETAANVAFKNATTIKKRLVVAGGGSGAKSFGAGGGGGGVVYETTALSCAAGTILSVQVGAGGAMMQNGDNTVANVGGEKITAIGGGHGGNWGSNAENKPSAGGSGGGGCAAFGGAAGTAGQGNAGGSGGSWAGAGGGGGATEAGGAYDATLKLGGHGGEGLTCDITGADEVYGSGGGGGGNIESGHAGNAGGTHAGHGGVSSHPAGYDADPGFGGGGGGNLYSGKQQDGGRGGSGVFVMLVEMPEGCTAVEIASSVQVPEEALDPGVGTMILGPGDQLTAQARNTTDPESGVSTLCRGYKLEQRIGGVWIEPVVSDSSTAVLQAGTAQAARLTWLWEGSLGPAAAYRDRYIEVSGRSVSRKRLGEDYVYVFSPSDEPLTVVLKQALYFNETLLVGGGGGGGAGFGGGGGGGGVIYQAPSNCLAGATVFKVKVGAGGASMVNGGDTSLVLGGQELVAKGGGHGGQWSWDASKKPTSGGSGGGGSGGFDGAAGTDTQGSAGGKKSANGTGGGGGAASAGGDCVGTQAGAGGAGLVLGISGSDETYGAGGGGGGHQENHIVSGAGGVNAGAGGELSHPAGYDAVPGFGGGGGGNFFPQGATVMSGGKGGDGTFVLRMSPVDKTRYGLFIVVQ